MIHVLPNDFMHCLLASHCADEVSHKFEIKEGQKVSYGADNKLVTCLLSTRNVEINKLVAGWVIGKIVRDADTGYLGVGYVNTTRKHMILAHCSTNFALSLGANMFKASGVQTDVDSVLMGKIVEHQACGYAATFAAISLARDKHFTLSFTGHSLGAWLAELSVYYCNFSFKYKDIKAVTFDGPGSYEMMLQMSGSEIKGSNSFDVQQLDITSYLSPPNIVNCANKHVGTVYRLFPEIEEENWGNHPILNTVESIIGAKRAISGLIAVKGHDLCYIVPMFLANTGKPEVYSRVDQWPSITYKNFGDDSPTPINRLCCNLLGKAVSGIFNRLGTMIVSPVISALTERLTEGTTTLGSIVSLGVALFDGQIEQKQFWLAHSYLRGPSYMLCSPLNLRESFFLRYKAHYDVQAQTEGHKKKVTDELDRVLKEVTLKNNIFDSRHYQSDAKDFVLAISEIAGVISYDKITQEIIIQNSSRGVLTVAELRDAARCIRHRYPNFLDRYLNNQSLILQSSTVSQRLLNAIEILEARCNELEHSQRETRKMLLSAQEALPRPRGV